MGKCAIYVRISQDREGAGLGVKDQEDDCRELAGKRGLTVAEVFVDNDVSAYSAKPRSRYQDMLAAIADGQVSAVIAWHTDRLHRSPKELEHYIDLTGHVVTHTVKAGMVDLATPHGRLIARQLGALARYESEHKSERVARAYQRRVEDGGFGGGTRRFGFEKDGLAVRKVEAAEIVKATDAILVGASLRSIVTDLNSRGVTTAAGNPWSHQRVREMLVRPRNAGILVYQGREAGQASWDAIVPEEHFREVCRILGDPSRRTSASNRASALGSGLYRCGRCAETKATRVRIGYSGAGGRVRAYRCPDSAHLTRAAAPTDAYVEAALVDVLTKWQKEGKLTISEREDLSEVYGERQVLAGRLDELADLFASGDITGEQLKGASAKLRVEIAALDARIGSTSAHSPLTALGGEVDIATAWKALDLSRRRAILDVVATVTLLPARNRGGKFDTTAVRVSPKESATVVK